MRILLWAEFQKLRRSNIILFTIFATVLMAVVVFVSGITTVSDDQLTTSTAGWYMTVTQVWATMFVLPAVIALLGSYMICREEQDDTMKSLRLIPVNEVKLTIAKMTVVFIFSILIYLLLFAITFSVEAVLHFSALSMKMILDFFKMYFIEGIGVFLAVSPIIAIVPYLKKSYWFALIVAEIYSFAGLFMSMSTTLRTFYPITAVFGISGYYDTTMKNYICSLIILLLCVGFSILLLRGLNNKQKGKQTHEEII
ncbi:ABC transporter permease [Clostridioides difficile]|uniref:ABC transporter permease n=1 Tax=Clostridioides difficile TaxID=1496 RepID=UPI002FCD8ECC